MRPAVAPVLRRQLGDEPAEALIQLVDAAGERWKEDVLSVSAERFERRLVEETSKLRVEMAQQDAATRAEMAEQGAATRGEIAQLGCALRGEMAQWGGSLRGEIAAARVEIVRWAFLFSIGQVAATAAVVGYLVSRG